MMTQLLMLLTTKMSSMMLEETTNQGRETEFENRSKILNSDLNRYKILIKITKIESKYNFFTKLESKNLKKSNQTF